MELLTPNPDLEMLQLNKESGYNWRERRHADWSENYQLYRDKVTINRLTQRQSVNLPLMKQTIRSMLKDVDDMPVLIFENLDNDKQKEVFYKEYWRWTVEQNKLDLKDIVDKKQVFLFGRSFTQLNIVDGRVRFDIVDPQDILVDRYCDPTDLDTARFLIHTHIFKPLSSIEHNAFYDRQAVARLKQFHATKQGLIKAEDNLQMLTERNERMAQMGVQDIGHPVLGETYIELSLHFNYRYDNDKKREVLWLYVEGDNQEILAKKPFEEVIGKTQDDYWTNHLTYTSWADDLERTDFWSDGIADIVRTPNKVLNSWFSQLVENRTLRNFGMHYYNASLEGFHPQTFEPVPWGWYPVPGNPNEVLQKVDIPDLSESLDEMKFLIEMSERASGATATQQGAQTERQVTLGEVQLTLAEAKQRVQSMAKFYIPAWQERGHKFIKLCEAAGDKLDAVKVYRKGKSGDRIYSRTISPNDWQSKSGYQCRVLSQEEKDTNDTQKLQKLAAVKAAMPDNLKLLEIYQKKLLEFADLTPDDITAVLEFEQQKVAAMTGQGTPGMMGGPMQPGMPGQVAPGMMPAPQTPAQLPQSLPQ